MGDGSLQLEHPDITISSAWSKAGVGTSIRIQGKRKEEDLLLDCGRFDESCFRAKHVFLTHGHIDHCGAVILHARSRSLQKLSTYVYVPSEMYEPLARAQREFEELDGGEFGIELKILRPGEVVVISPHMEVFAFPTDHRVPSQGYGVNLIKSGGLRPEYSGEDKLKIRELKRSGEEVNLPDVRELALAYTGDTRFGCLLDASLIHILRAKILIMEVTYLDDDRAKAHDRGHIHVDDIVEHAKFLQDTKLVIVHVSQKYHCVSRIIDLLCEKLPESLRQGTVVALKSFGAEFDFLSLSQRQEEVGWGWAKYYGKHLSAKKALTHEHEIVVGNSAGTSCVNDVHISSMGICLEPKVEGNN